MYEFSFKFDTVLYQFLVTGTSDKCLKCIDQLLTLSSFILYPLSFFLYSPFNWYSDKNTHHERFYMVQ